MPPAPANTDQPSKRRQPAAAEQTQARDADEEQADPI
jgi:hypothetical protein